MLIRVSGILDSTLTNGEGMRTVIFGSGCKHKCPSCHNEELQSPIAGVNFTIDDIINRIEKNSLVTRKKVTFSGGDPFFQAKEFYLLAKELKEKEYNIWCYTGYTIEQILNSNNVDFLKLLSSVDVLVDGRFEESLTKNAQKYTGSSNQKIININKYLESNNIDLKSLIEISK